MSEPASPPSDDDRRHAACLAMGSAPGLIRFAARYTRSLHDAEDAYQRAMEIALTRAPVTEQRRFMAWLHTVLRNEALAVARVRRREGPGVEADVTEAYENTLEAAVRIDAIAEWRERYRSIQDGLAGLTDAQRICLMLQTAGVSYERIREITGFSLRKVERSVLEGRSRLAAWEVRLASGEACERLDPMIGRVASGEATAKEARVVSRHVRHCGHCRAVLRDRRESNEWLAGLVPVALLGSHAFAGAPDPTPVIAWWERVSGGATVRMGTMVQMAMDLPSSALARVGAGTAAVAVAGAAGAPIVADAMRPAATEPQVAAIARSTASPVRTAGATTTLDAERIAETFARARRAAAEATRRRTRSEARASRPASAAPRATAPVRSVAVSTSTASRATRRVSTPVPRPAPAPAPPSPPPTTSAVALEFGP
jgi:RNA polymerase sigma factor (sigma-70 family)